MTLKTTRATLTHISICNTGILRISSFNPFHSMASRFRVTDHFEISALNDSKLPYTKHIFLLELPIPNFNFSSINN